MELYFNMYKSRYTYINELIKSSNIDFSKPIDIYIDMDPVLTKLTSPKNIEYLKVKNDEKHLEFMSNVLNLIAHYKGFFIQHAVHVNVYLYMQYPFESDTQLNRKYNSEYRYYWEYKYTNETAVPLYNIVSNTFDNIQTIASYIKNVYVIRPNNIEGSLIPRILMNESHNNILITQDLYNFQYVNYGFHILVPKQVNTALLSSDTVIDYIKSANNINNPFGYNPGFTLSSKLLPFILSISGNKYRNVYKLKGFGFKTIFRALDIAITQNIITDKTDNIDLLLEIIKKGSRDAVRQNFLCTDIESQYRDLTSIEIESVRSQLIDIYNPDELNILNNKYFAMYPLQIIELTTELRKRSKKEPIIF